MYRVFNQDMPKTQALKLFLLRLRQLKFQHIFRGSVSGVFFVKIEIISFDFEAHKSDGPNYFAAAFFW
jgi:hypothetical protein